MNYPTMNSAEEPVNMKPVADSNSVVMILEDTQRALCEMRGMLMKIQTNIASVSSPENDKPIANCMNEQAIINRNLAMMCRDLVTEISLILFGE